LPPGLGLACGVGKSGRGDADFDVVVSTFSLHHRPSPAKCHAEIDRALRPGGVAHVYDVVDRIRRFEQGGKGIAEAAEESPSKERGEYSRASVPGSARSRSPTGPDL